MIVQLIVLKLVASAPKTIEKNCSPLRIDWYVGISYRMTELSTNAGCWLILLK